MSKENELQKIIEILSSDYECVLHVDFDSGKETYYRNSSLFSSYVPRWNETNNYKERILSFATSLVVPEDREQFLYEVSPDVVSEKVKSGKPYIVIFRIKINNEIFYYQAKFIHHLAYINRNSTLIGISNITSVLEKTRRDEAVLKALSDDFEYVSYLDLVSFNEIIFRHFDVLEKEYPFWMSLTNYSERIDFVSNNFVHPDDKEFFLENTSIDNVLAQLANQSSFDFTFRIIFNNEPIYFLGKYVSINLEGQSHVVIGFKSVNDIIKKQISTQHKLEENLEIISILASEYSSIFYVNLKNNSIKTYAINSPLLKSVLRNYAAKGSYSESLEFIVDKLVYENDKEDTKRLCSLSNIINELSNKKKFSKYFRTSFEGNIKYCEVEFIKANEEETNPTHIIMGIRERDKEISANFVNEKLLSEYASIFLVDLETDERKFIYRSNTSGFPDEEGGHYTSVIKEYASRVANPYREQWENMASLDYMKQYLANDDRREYVYQLSGVDLKWRRCLCQVVARNKGVPSLFIMTYTTLDFSSAEKAELDSKIAEQKLALETQQIALEKALDLAQSANRAKTTFLNNMSHDIRTPMNAIIGFTNLAINHIDDTETVQDYLNKINRSSQHLLSLINDILDMSRIESGKMTLSEKEEDLTEIIHNLRDIVYSDVNLKQQDLYVDSYGIDDENVLVDRLRLNQVLLNILSNSIKYTPAGGTLSLKAEQKELTENGYGIYEFRIKDNGIGMSKEFVKTIFEPFTRAKSSTVSGIQGTGLGMAITKSIIDMMGGRISIESEEGKGTETIITFEFKVVGEEKATTSLEQLKDRRALIIDDSSNDCLSIHQMLSDLGVESDYVLSGEAGVAKVKEEIKRGNIYDYFIIDYVMRGADGIETARQIRPLVGEKSKIIITSAFDLSDLKEKEKSCINEFVNKPLFQNDLMNALLPKKKNKKKKQSKTIYNFNGKKILLVEDNELNREIATAILEEEGFVITSAEDGSIAVDILKNAKAGDFDIILMDVQMPIMDGYEATRLIRKLENKQISSLPIFAMTANAFEEDKQEALKAGMNEHISKPLDVIKLKETLAKYLK